MSKIWAAHLAARLLTRQDISVKGHMRPLPGKVNHLPVKAVETRGTLR